VLPVGPLLLEGQCLVELQPQVEPDDTEWECDQERMRQPHLLIASSESVVMSAVLMTAPRVNPPSVPNSRKLSNDRRPIGFGGRHAALLL